MYGNLLTGVYSGEVSDYALKSLVFVSKNLQAAVEVVREICSFLYDNGTAFSLLISDCGRRFFLFPQVIAYPFPCLLILHCVYLGGKNGRKGKSTFPLFIWKERKGKKN